ncbi:MAG: sensor histidine kinase [Bryobacteraceae bacterium]
MADVSKIRWTESIGWVRVVLTAALLFMVWAAVPRTPAWIYGLVALYLGGAVAMVWRGWGRGGMAGLLVLFQDAVFLLVAASYGAERLLWWSSAFYLFVLAEGIAFYGPIEVGVVGGVVALFCILAPQPGLRDLEYAAVVGGALGCWLAAARRRREQEAMRVAGQVEETRRGAQRAAEDERQRIASDFHDGPLQNFISLQMRLEVLRKLLSRDLEAGMDELRQLQAVAQSQVRDLRVFLHAMRPVDVDAADLVVTARRTAEAFQKESGIPVAFIGTAAPVGLSQESTSEVLQMIREALYNVQKHSGATRVAVALEKSEKALEISVEDNGHGFTFAGSYSLEELELLRLGPNSLKRRARTLNADMQLESRPGRGAGLRVRVPLQ